MLPGLASGFSKTLTEWPPARSCSVTEDPMKPAPPRTNDRMDPITRVAARVPRELVDFCLVSTGVGCPGEIRASAAEEIPHGARSRNFDECLLDGGRQGFWIVGSNDTDGIGRAHERAEISSPGSRRADNWEATGERLQLNEGHAFLTRR